MLYTKLCSIQREHTFNGNAVSTCQISEFSEGHDFFAVFLSISGKRVGLISNGDFKGEFERVFGIIKDKIDVLVCVSRAINVAGSVREYIFNSLPQQGFKVKFNLTTFPCANNDEKKRNGVEHKRPNCFNFNKITIMKNKIKLLAIFLATTTASLADNEVFDGQDVSGENFSNSSLRNSQWKNTTIKETNFTSSNLTSGDFYNSKLTNVDFSNAILKYADFYGATLTDVSF